MDIEQGSVWIPFPTMERFMRDVFTGLGVPRADAAICAKVLIKADQLGFDSHGISRLKPIYYDRIRQGIQRAQTRIGRVKNTPTTAVLDGGNGMGHVVAHHAMTLAIRKARRYGLGMVAVRNSTHYGIAGYYALMAAQAGMIGISGTNARPSIAPTFGVENMLGTNPLTFALPTDEKFPFLLDCATSIVQRGKVEIYAKLDKPMPAGWVIAPDGSSKTDPHQVLTDLVAGTAALLPLGGAGEDLAGYKGYGYATVVEILSAALQQGAYLKMLSGVDRKGRKIPYPLGHFFLAIDIAHFAPLASFKQIAGRILRQLRASQKAPGQNRIYTAGEKEYLTWRERRGKGVPVNRETQKEILAMREELGLKKYRFPFDP
ncbi:MAG: Ldh family oxidoreductase [Kiritimatiellae bacterium]|jgi:LDH2 family malate/lactate/ureidoglycolate dehydrogenase|nr:Ldh family oxidoreductase [Kiritimatiellia bacterium]NLD89840.1 Ldh family oxidoreductase [Lentisphaerota bacterium]HOU21396.1 Ldh family oxidoreductase [Kiritimatiellia bacterium]HPC19970.1 Ldh family oxidoreductase [Kiritimatiellia bacterium]HQN80418.1 Ldh family oxidoreductase [Kiritimatiellia bacterium]